jgi:hypothetical protein
MSDDCIIASWEESPYTSYDKRGVVIHHRVRLVHYDSTSADVLHERREDGDSWVTVTVAEMRSHGMTVHTQRDGVLEE